VTVVGTNFYNTDSARCSFGYYIQRATVLSSTTLWCITPPHLPFTSVAVEVSNNNFNFTADDVQVRVWVKFAALVSFSGF
jgi:hypothetical protein